MEMPLFHPIKRVSRVRAAAIALARVAQWMIGCEAFDVLPKWYKPGYAAGKPPKNCWYVFCGQKEPITTGGISTLLCVSKRSGRVLFIENIHGE